ncbi:MAG TPA: hypothetical protein VFH27_17065 [Longimicrobiaceae bacterium]|nr:hypothetical protein [Longimicrobiaceae bacterium]
MSIVGLLAGICVVVSLGAATGSTLLQLIAWTRHARPGVGVNPMAVWKPEGYFDGVGLRQMLIARRLLLVGLAGYLSVGVLFVLSRVLH